MGIVHTASANIGGTFTHASVGYVGGRVAAALVSRFLNEEQREAAQMLAPAVGTAIGAISGLIDGWRTRRAADRDLDVIESNIGMLQQQLDKQQPLNRDLMERTVELLARSHHKDTFYSTVGGLAYGTILGGVGTYGVREATGQHRRGFADEFAGMKRPDRLEMAAAGLGAAALGFLGFRSRADGRRDEALEDMRELVARYQQQSAGRTES